MNEDYLEALYKAGAPRGIGATELDQYAATLLKIDERTARRYRAGDIPVRGPVWVALEALAANRGT